jgi:signal transduction histidine kinase
VRPLSYALIVATLLALLTWLLLGGMNPEARATQEALHALDRLAIAQSALQRDVLRARSGLLRNYDPLNAGLAGSRDALRILRGGVAAIPSLQPEVTALAAMLDEQETLTEQFKSANALLQNSLAYFSLFSTWLNTYSDTQARPSPLLSALAVAMLHLTLDASPTAAREVALLLNYLSDQSPQGTGADTIAGLLAHGRMLHRLLPEVDWQLKALAQLPIEDKRESLRAAVLEHHRFGEGLATRHRLLLYGVSLGLLGVLIAIGLRLRQRAQSLQRRASLEHVMARISTRFLVAPPHKAAAHIEGALAELAEQIGADRAYFLMRSTTCRHVHVWCRPGLGLPESWPENAFVTATELRRSKGGIIHVADVGCLSDGRAKDALLAAGIAGWACVPAMGGEFRNAVLAFDSLTPGGLTTSEEVSLLRVAYDAIAGALHRQLLDTERVRLESHLEKSRRMETVGALASGIAHNFNNIVGAILGYAEIAQMHASPNGRLAGSIDGIRQAGERARTLVEQILTFGRRRELRRAPIALHALIGEARSLLNASLPPRVALEVREKEGSGTISGEAGQLQQVILNLCTNAAQAIDGSGRILVETAMLDSPVAVQLSHGALPAGTYGIIAVEDNGRGMTEETAKRIFEPFFTTRMAGNGLGLATVREIVGDHGGAIDVRTAPGVGTRFAIWLPCSAGLPASDDGAKPAAIPFGHGETVLLLAEDQGRLLRCEEVVAALGYEPVGFVNPDAALAACRCAPERFDVALVKQRPAAAAIRFAASLHAAAPNLPILVAALMTDEHDAATLIEAGVFELVRKPLASTELAEVLARCLARAGVPQPHALSA